MKIVNRKEFLECKEGTLFSKYEPCVFEFLCIKGKTIGECNDFFYQSIHNSISCNNSDEFMELLEKSKKEKISLKMDFNIEGRDACFDDYQLFVIWEKEDVIKLIERLKRCID